MAKPLVHWIRLGRRDTPCKLKDDETGRFLVIQARDLTFPIIDEITCERCQAEARRLALSIKE